MPMRTLSVLEVRAQGLAEDGRDGRPIFGSGVFGGVPKLVLYAHHSMTVLRPRLVWHRQSLPQADHRNRLHVCDGFRPGLLDHKDTMFGSAEGGTSRRGGRTRRISRDACELAMEFHRRPARLRRSHPEVPPRSCCVQRSLLERVRCVRTGVPATCGNLSRIARSCGQPERLARLEQSDRIGVVLRGERVADREVLTSGEYVGGVCVLGCGVCVHVGIIARCTYTRQESEPTSVLRW